MGNYIDGIALRKLLLGKKVERAAATHLAATTPYFTVATGRILLTGLVGTITVASGANVCSWTVTPTTGTASPLCGNLDINPALVGDVLTITGLAGDAMIYGAAAGRGWMERCVPIPIGTIDLIAAAADGATSWTLFYVPIDDGAYVTAT